MDFCHVSLPDCIYRRCLWEFGGHPRKYRGEMHGNPHRVAISSGLQWSGTHFAAETNCPTLRVPMGITNSSSNKQCPCATFLLFCLHQSIGSSPETKQPPKTWLAFGKLDWSGFFLQKLVNTCKQFRQTLDQELQCWRRNILFKSYQSSLCNKLSRFHKDVGTNLERLFLEMSKFS